MRDSTRWTTALVLLTMGLSIMPEPLAGEARTVLRHPKFALTIPQGWTVQRTWGKPCRVELVESHPRPTLIIASEWDKSETLSELLKAPALWHLVGEKLAEGIRAGAGPCEMLVPTKRRLQAPTVCHLLVRGRLGGRPGNMEVVFLHAHDTLHCLQVVTAEGREAEVAQAVDAVLASYCPHEAAAIPGAVFKHPKFALRVPQGWRLEQRPETPDTVRVIETHQDAAAVEVRVEPLEPGAQAVLSYPTMRQAAARKSEMGFLLGVGPGGKRTAPPRFMHFDLITNVLVDREVNGRATSIECIVGCAFRRRYALSVSVPRAREAELSRPVEGLLASFRPQGKAPTEAQKLEELRVALTRDAQDLPRNWSAELAAVRLLSNSPSQGQSTLLLVTRWPRTDLKEAFAQAKAGYDAERAGRVPPEPGSEASLRLVRYASRLAHMGGMFAGILTPSPDYVVLRMLDAHGHEAGSLRIPTTLVAQGIAGKIAAADFGSKFELIAPQPDKP